MQAKTLSTDFDAQLEAAEARFGRQLWFRFDREDIDRVLTEASLYGEAERERVAAILRHQMRKYAYLFR